MANVSDCCPQGWHNPLLWNHNSSSQRSFAKTIAYHLNKEKTVPQITIESDRKTSLYACEYSSKEENLDNEDTFQEALDTLTKLDTVYPVQPLSCWNCMKSKQEMIKSNKSLDMNDLISLPCMIISKFQNRQRIFELVWLSIKNHALVFSLSVPHQMPVHTNIISLAFT